MHVNHDQKNQLEWYEKFLLEMFGMKLEKKIFRRLYRQ
jgi:hypothetical protein